jgi:hypothetical protein
MSDCLDLLDIDTCLPRFFFHPVKSPSLKIWIVYQGFVEVVELSPEWASVVLTPTSPLISPSSWERPAVNTSPLHFYPLQDSNIPSRYFSENLFSNTRPYSMLSRLLKSILSTHITPRFWLSKLMNYSEPLGHLRPRSYKPAWKQPTYTTVRTTITITVSLKQLTCTTVKTWSRLRTISDLFPRKCGRLTAGWILNSMSWFEALWHATK